MGFPINAIVPALLTEASIELDANPRLNSCSACGERQMFPVQTTKI
jgi:hypothetical protein